MATRESAIIQQRGCAQTDRIAELRELFAHVGVLVTGTVLPSRAVARYYNTRGRLVKHGSRRKGISSGGCSATCCEDRGAAGAGRIAGDR